MRSWKLSTGGRSSHGFKVAVIVLSAALFSCLAPAAAEPGDGVVSEWTRGLERTLTTGGMAGASVSALVVRERDGKVLYERQPDRLMTPASNTKVLTALAALDAFGPTHEFETTLATDAPPGPDGMVQTLYVRGGGDPAVTNEDYWRLAAELREKGLRGVRGDIVVDDSLFDRVRWHPSVNGVSSRAYHAPVGALNANYGSFAVTVRPGPSVGAPVSVIVTPPLPYLRLSNQGRTLAKSVRRSLVVDRSEDDGVEVVTVRGGLRVGDKTKTYYRSVAHPERYAAAVLKMQLASLGIDVAGGVRTGSAPDNAHALHTFKGRPLGEIVRLFMKFSNNSIAEALVKHLALVAERSVGTWEAGVPEMRKRLIALGVPANGFHLVDGSGLSYHDRVSPRAFVAALRAARASFGSNAEFISSLPIAARDGTLKDRAEGAQDHARAKTGLLNGVTGLSGYALVASAASKSADGANELVAFSVLANDYRKSDKEAMDSLDAFLVQLTGHATGN